MIPYIVECVVAIIAIIASIIIFRKSEPKKFLRTLLAILVFLIVAELITLFFDKPKIDLEEENVTIEAKTENSLKIAKTKYIFFDVTDKVQIEGNVDYNQIGTYEVTYKVPMIFGTYKQKVTINVVDKAAPEITLEAGEEYNQSYSQEFQEPGFTANDAYDGDLTEKVTVEKNQISDTEMQVTYIVTDSSGNTATKVRNVHIVDDVPPVITLNGNATMTLIIGKSYEEKGAKANDEKDGDLTDKIQIEGSVDSSKEGTYEITYKVSDTKGNEGTKTRKIIVLAEEIKARTGTDGEPRSCLFNI